MRVALIGATGFVGKTVLNELLHRGHQVIAISRSADESNTENIQVVQADVTDINVLADAIKEADAVISAFNAGWQNPNLYHDFLEGSRAIQTSVKRAGIKRLIVIGGAGSLYIDGKQLVDSPDFPEAWKAGATAARDYLDQLREETDLDWVFLSPAIEMHPGTSGVRKGTYRKGGDSPVFDEKGKSIISVEDLAVAVADELEGVSHSRERFTVAY